MPTIRTAAGPDAASIRDLFLTCYGTDYAYPQYYDLDSLTRIIYSEDALVLVAEEAGRVVGTASVVLQVGAYADLVGEFGRLAVHPDARHRGVGKALLAERLRRVQDQLHVGVVEARVAHPYTLRIAEAQGFAFVGFVPLKMLLARRESLALMVRHFNASLGLRRNHPHVIPEVYPVAHLAMENCGLPCDAIVDEDSAAYPAATGFALQELTADGYAGLLRIERGRVRNREIFGPMRLHYGFFKLQARRSTYFLAREDGRVVGAVGFMVDPVEKTVRIFELIALHDHVVRFLLAEVEKLCRETWGVAYLEADVSAYAPRMQRTLLEVGFLPVAYLPGLVFHEVERLDVVKMVRLLTPLDLGPIALSPGAQAMADLVLRGFRSRGVLPRIAAAVLQASLFAGLNEEQATRLAGACTLKTFPAGAVIQREGELDSDLHVILSGEAAIEKAGARGPVARLGAGECVGEMTLLTATPHSATATAVRPVEAAALSHKELAELVRLRPDIGLQLYKNLAVGMGQKLRRS